MNRRNFLKSSSLTGLALTALPAIAVNNSATNPKSNYKDVFQLNEITINELQQKMQSGALTSRMITEMYLKRINTIDKKGPAINAIIELNPDALSIATKMDAERKAGKIRGPLHGIPILIKDNINTGDKMQ